MVVPIDVNWAVTRVVSLVGQMAGERAALMAGQKVAQRAGERAVPLVGQLVVTRAAYWAVQMGEMSADKLVVTRVVELAATRVVELAVTMALK